MKKILLLILLSAALCTRGSAPGGIVLITLQSQKAISRYTAEKGVTVSSKQNRKTLAHELSFRGANLNGKWQKVSFSFTPEHDGKITLSIGAAFDGSNRVHPFLHVDKVEIRGSSLKNPGFEKYDAKGVPLHWQGGRKSTAQKGTLEGKSYARVNYLSPLTQKMELRKGKKVTLSLHVRQESPLHNSRGKDGMTNIYTDWDGTKLHISSGRVTLIPSFENCSYYINRTPAEWGKKCQIKVWYRPKGSSKWIPVLDPVDMEKEKAWRGSIMLLKENTLYEFKAVISGEKSCELRRSFRTRDSRFKIGKTIVLNEKNFKGVLKNIISGTKEGYTLYKATPGFILKGKKELSGAVIECTNARFVIFDGLTIDANGSRHGIKMTDCSDMVIRNCNISNFGLWENFRDMKQLGRWTYKGKVMNYDGGIALYGGKNQLIEKCYIHSPNSTANSWFYSHPAGPSAIHVYYVKGGTVIRWNDFVANDKRRWNDAVEGSGNGLIYGGFCRDADIYGNLFAFSNDDSIELEGGEMNIRFYYNRVQGSLSGVSSGSCRLGPSYQYRNVYYKLGDENNYKGCSLKNSHGSQGDGALFFLNNSIYSPGANVALNTPHSMPPAYSPPLKAFSRNNIFSYTDDSFLFQRWNELNKDFDYDIFHTHSPALRKETALLAKALGQEKNALYVDPGYIDPENGDLRLKADSPARNSAFPLPGLPVTHRGAFQEDGIDIPYRPLPVSLDKKELNFTHADRKKSLVFTAKADSKEFDSSFKVHCNDDFFKVTPASGRLKGSEKITFTVTLNNKNIKAARVHNGMVVLRFADGCSKVLSVYADFREDRILKAADRKDLIHVRDLKRTGDVYQGKVTIPEKGCYFLFAEGEYPKGMGRVRAVAAIGKERSGSAARFTEIRKGLGVIYTGSFSNWYFFLDKGELPFTFKGNKSTKKIKGFFVTRHPEKVLR